MITAVRAGERRAITLYAKDAKNKDELREKTFQFIIWL